MADPGPCEQLGLSAKAERKCSMLRQEFDLSPSLISACSSFSKTDDGKLDCVRSGAPVETVEFCEKQQFLSEKMALSCLHYANDEDRTNSCVKGGYKDEALISCLMSSQSASAIDRCSTLGSEHRRLDCIQNGLDTSSRGLANAALRP